MAHETLLQVSLLSDDKLKYDKEPNFEGTDEKQKN
jgi:hypothetical protein